MRELKDYTAEVLRRVEVTRAERRRNRARLLAICLPLVICVALGALALPPWMRDAAPGPDQIRENETGSKTASREPVLDTAQVDGDAEGEQVQDGFMSVDDPVTGGAVDGVDAAVPEDFAFSYTWGCYGVSSYDSETGKLVKTTDATHPEDYVTELHLTKEQLQQVWTWLLQLPLAEYPASYDPYNDPASEQKIATEPSRDLVLTVRQRGTETTIACRNICLGGSSGGYDEKAKAFLAFCDRLERLLTGTPEWEALPPYEFLYE